MSELFVERELKADYGVEFPSDFAQKEISRLETFARDLAKKHGKKIQLAKLVDKDVLQFGPGFGLWSKMPIEQSLAKLLKEFSEIVYGSRINELLEADLSIHLSAGPKYTKISVNNIRQGDFEIWLYEEDEESDNSPVRFVYSIKHPGETNIKVGSEIAEKMLEFFVLNS